MCKTDRQWCGAPYRSTFENYHDLQHAICTSTGGGGGKSIIFSHWAKPFQFDSLCIHTNVDSFDCINVTWTLVALLCCEDQYVSMRSTQVYVCRVVERSEQWREWVPANWILYILYRNFYCQCRTNNSYIFSTSTRGSFYRIFSLFLCRSLQFSVIFSIWTVETNKHHINFAISQAFKHKFIHTEHWKRGFYFSTFWRAAYRVHVVRKGRSRSNHIYTGLYTMCTRTARYQ